MSQHSGISMRGKTVVWIVVVAVLALIGAVVAIGYLLPIGHRASVDTEVSAPVEEVYALITQAENFPAWRSGVKSVDILDSRDGKRRYRENGSDGSIAYIVEAEQANRVLVTRIDDRKLPFSASGLSSLRPGQTAAQT
jgi:uncharacterized membrane protein